ncbi:MAG: imidazolonepropionase [Planctomycetota bacterium]
MTEGQTLRIHRSNSPDTLFRGFKIATMLESSELENAQPDLPCALNPTNYGTIEKGTLAVTDGVIDWIVPESETPQVPADVEIIEGAGKWLTPGLIDCHTHLVYGGDRASEWEARLGGQSYQAIAKAGGGILSSVRATRAASEDELVESATKRLMYLLSEGVTTIEIKSGYGLDLENEIKMLRAANRVGAENRVDVFSTLLSAHAVPPEFAQRPDDYVTLICEEIIPTAKDECHAVDAFCESIAFSVEQTKRVLMTGKDCGLSIKVHAEQLTHTGIAAEVAKMGGLSADHLEFLTAADCAVLAEHGTVATLLPGAFFCLQETQKPPLEALRNHHVPIAIATDCNPGSSPVVSILTIGNMACNLFGMTPEETLKGMTRNAALALGLNDRGVIKPGAIADFAVWDVASPGEIFYQIGANPCVDVFKNGKRSRSWVAHEQR